MKSATKNFDLEEKPLVSVIVPVYNTEKYLKKCVNSILTQTYENIELFLIDDGSTDKSGEICDGFAEEDSRVKVIHKENEGQAVARNCALDVCKGEYIFFVDSDDYIRQDAVGRLVETVTQHKADLVLFGFEYDYVKYKKKRLVYENLRTFAKEKLLTEYIVNNGITAALCDKFYKRRLFEELRFPRLRANEDAYVLPEIFGSAEKAVYLREALYTQLVRVGSTEQSGFKESKLALLEVAKHKKEYIDANFPQLSKFIELDYAKTVKRMLSSILSSFLYKKYKETYLKLLEELKSELENKNVSTIDPILYKQLMNCIKHQNIFKLKARLYGTKRFFIQKVKAFLQR